MTHDPLYANLESDFEAQTVLGWIGRGRDASTSLGTIAEELGWPRRVIELSIQRLRLAGFPICSDGSGAWWGDDADVEACLSSLNKRIRSQYATYRALRNTLRRMRGRKVQQTTLFGEAA